MTVFPIFDAGACTLVYKVPGYLPFATNTKHLNNQFLKLKH